MSVEVMAAVFRMNMPELKTDKGQVVSDSSCKFVLLALADHANEEGEGAYPSVQRLCKKTNLSTATVCNALNALRTNGFTSLEGRSKADTYNYTILVARIREFQWVESSDSNDRNPSVLASKIKPSSTKHQPSESLLTASDEKEVISFFTENFGFLSEYQSMTKTERTRLLVLAAQVGKETVKEIMAWAAKKEIHLSNRSGLLDSLETAAGDWRKKVKYPKREEKTVRVSPEEIIRRYVLEHPTV